MTTEDRLAIEAELFALLIAPQLALSVKKHLIAVFESFLMFENLDANGKSCSSFFSLPHYDALVRPADFLFRQAQTFTRSSAFR